MSLLGIIKSDVIELKKYVNEIRIQNTYTKYENKAAYRNKKLNFISP